MCEFTYVFYFYLQKALEIRGNGHPLIIGLSPVITCSTHLTVIRMEWLLLGFAEFALGVSSTQTVSLAPTLTSGGLDGAMLKCRATTPAHGVYEETITLAVIGIHGIVYFVSICSLACQVNIFFFLKQAW